MFHSQPLNLPRRQDGVAAVEFAIIVWSIALMMALLLQVGRTCLLYNVSVSAAYSATMHVATMPNAELLNSSVARPSTLAIVEKMRQGGAIDVSDNTFNATFTCTPNTAAPCYGSTLPTQVHVRIEHIQRDAIFPAFTTDIDYQIDSIFIRYRARIPRVGFVL